MMKQTEDMILLFLLANISLRLDAAIISSLSANFFQINFNHCNTTNFCHLRLARQQALVNLWREMGLQKKDFYQITFSLIYQGRYQKISVILNFGSLKMRYIFFFNIIIAPVLWLIESKNLNFLSKPKICYASFNGKWNVNSPTFSLLFTVFFTLNLNTFYWIGRANCPQQFYCLLSCYLMSNMFSILLS